MIGTVVAAIIGTIAFSLLFSVPRKLYLMCGLIGGLGWLIYMLLTGYTFLGPTSATYCATVVVVLASRFTAVKAKCPSTLFLIPGIFPLVPGAGIYWTSYYLVTGQLTEAVSSGFSALKIAFAIVFGIVTVFELPAKFFRLGTKKVAKQ